MEIDINESVKLEEKYRAYLSLWQRIKNIISNIIKIDDEIQELIKKEKKNES